MTWVVAQTDPQREHVAVHHLALAGYADTYLPRIRQSRRTRQGKIYNVTTPLFPSYLFLNILDGRWWSARWAIGIRAILMGADERPAAIGDQVILELRSREKNGLIQLPSKRPEFLRGDPIQVTGGLFTGKLGLFQDMRPHDRVLVLLQWLGAERPVELAKQNIRRVL